MRKLWLSMLCALVFLGTATVSEAKIFVSISDGTTTLDGRTLNLPAPNPPGGKGLLLLLKTSPAPPLPVPPALPTDVTDTLTILTCATKPCTVFFPSGAATQQGTPGQPGGDTFKIQDVSTLNLAKVTKLDAGTAPDRVSFSGIKITSLVAGKVLTVIYGTQTNDLRVLTSAQAAAYTVSAAMSGSFKTSAGVRATACKAGSVTDVDTVGEACVQLSVTLNGASVDGQAPSVVATVAAACNNSSPVTPCGTNGTWTATTGTFQGLNDGQSKSCPSTCSPFQVGTLIGRFNGANEVLQLTASLNGVISNVTDQNGGVEDAAIALADEVPLNRWVTTSAKAELCKAVAKAPTTNDTRNITSGASLPISFEYWCGKYSPAGAAGVPLISLADTALIPGAAGAKYMAARETFLPNPPGPNGQLFKQINILTLRYLVAQGSELADTRLDNPVTYSDCVDGSIRLEIQLVDSSGVDKGTMKVYLGDNNPDNPFKTGCINFDGNNGTVDVDIRNNPDARVDASGIQVNNPPSGLVTFGSLQNGQIGNLFVRRIAFIVDRGVTGAADQVVPPDLPLNFKVTFFDGNVNGISALQSGALQVVTDFVRVTPTSTNGVYIAVTKLLGLGAGVVKVIPPTDIVINGGKYTASVKVVDIQAESGMPYAISLCPNGVVTGFNPDPPNLNPVVGICIADNARFSFQ